MVFYRIASAVSQKSFTFTNARLLNCARLVVHNTLVQAVAVAWFQGQSKVDTRHDSQARHSK